MTARHLLVPLFVAVAGATLAAAEAPQPTAREMLKARLAEEAKHPTAAPVPVTAPAGAAAAPTEKNPIVATVPNAAGEARPAGKAKDGATPPTVLPKVEVRKGRITELDRQLAKQDQDIARERKNTRPTEVDQALNDARIARPLSLFGGESSQFRQHVASERVSLMEDEKDLIEAIAHARTREEKVELQKQLDLLRAERRELEKALR